MYNGNRRELSEENAIELIYQLISRNFDRNTRELAEYAIGVLDWKSMSFNAILLHLQDVVVCEVCEEATHIDFAQSTEGMVGGGLGLEGTGYVCDYCKDTLD